MSDALLLYLNDTLKQLINLAEEIEVHKDDEFSQGKLHGFYIAISRLVNQAEAFGILELLDEEIKEFEPESLFSVIHNKQGS